MKALCFFLLIACCCDYWKGKIPNLLLVFMFIVGWGQSLIGEGLQEVIAFPVECAIVMLLLYPLFKIGALGAGDVKLYGVCAGYLPREKFLFFFFLSLLIAAVISLVKMIRESNAVERIFYFCEYLINVIRTGRFRLYIENEKERKAVSICLAGPILGSVLLYMGGVY